MFSWGPHQAQIPDRLLYDVILLYIHLREEVNVRQREGASVVTNSHATVCFPWISFYFFSSFDLHKIFSLLDDTDDISLLKWVKRLSYCSATRFLYFFKRLKSTQANNHVTSCKTATWRTVAENAVCVPGQIWLQLSNIVFVIQLGTCMNKQQDRWQKKTRHIEISTLYVKVALLFTEQEKFKPIHTQDTQECVMLQWFLVG